MDNAWFKTAEFARAVGAKKILFQSPKSFRPSERHMKDLKEFLKKIERNSFTFIWEPRGQWGRKEVEEVSKKSDIILCLDPYDDPLPERNLVYVRLHGRTGYRYTYSEDDLKQLLRRVQAYREVYLMFNNMTMFEDARRLKILLKAEKNHHS